MAEKDYYDILGVDRNASQSDINHAYRRLAAKYHPDVNHAPDAEQKFKDINEAYDVLSHPDKKARYDQYGTADAQQAGAGAGGFGGFNGAGGFGAQDFGGFDDIFNQMFGGGGTRQRRNPHAPQPGRDLQYTMTVKFKDAIFGKKTTISYDRMATCDKCHGTGMKPGKSRQTCPRCHGQGAIYTVRQTPLGRMQTQTTCPECNGTGEIIKEADKCDKCHGQTVIKEHHELEIQIPAGIDDGQQMRMQKQGDAGLNGGSYGDLYVKFNVTQSREFRRDGTSIYVDHNISFAQAALGDTVKVKTVRGDVDLKIPAGTQSGSQFRLRNEGVPKLNAGGRGDEFVKVHVETPKHMNKQQREAMMAYAAASGQKLKGYKQGFFDKLRDAFDDK